MVVSPGAAGGERVLLLNAHSPLIQRMAAMATSGDQRTAAKAVAFGAALLATALEPARKLDIPWDASFPSPASRAFIPSVPIEDLEHVTGPAPLAQAPAPSLAQSSATETGALHTYRIAARAGDGPPPSEEDASMAGYAFRSFPRSSYEPPRPDFHGVV